MYELREHSAAKATGCTPGDRVLFVNTPHNAVSSTGLAAVIHRPGMDKTNEYCIEQLEELVRRANALPAVEARLAEAVNLLRDLADKCPTMRFPDDIDNPTNDKTARGRARAFLAKVDA